MRLYGTWQPGSILCRHISHATAGDNELYAAIRVGLAGSRARFNVADHGEVLRLLQDLAETRPAENAAEARRMVQSGE